MHGSCKYTYFLIKAKGYDFPEYKSFYLGWWCLQSLKLNTYLAKTRQSDLCQHRPVLSTRYFPTAKEPYRKMKLLNCFWVYLVAICEHVCFQECELAMNVAATWTLMLSCYTGIFTRSGSSQEWRIIHCWGHLTCCRWLENRRAK